MKDNSCKDVKDIEPYIQIDNGSFSFKKKNKRKKHFYIFNWCQLGTMHTYILSDIDTNFVVFYSAGRYQQSSHIIQ